MVPDDSYGICHGPESRAPGVGYSGEYADGKVWDHPRPITLRRPLAAGVFVFFYLFSPLQRGGLKEGCMWGCIIINVKRFNNLPLLKSRRKQLRKESTSQETIFWSKLRRHQLGFKFKRQHSVGPYILDFYCPDKKLAIELDGSHHTDNKEYDTERSDYLKEFGINVLRFWNREADANIESVMARIKHELDLLPAKGEVPKAEGVN